MLNFNFKLWILSLNAFHGAENGSFFDESWIYMVGFLLVAEVLIEGFIWFLWITHFWVVFLSVFLLWTLIHFDWVFAIFKIQRVLGFGYFFVYLLLAWENVHLKSLFFSLFWIFNLKPMWYLESSVFMWLMNLGVFSWLLYFATDSFCLISLMLVFVWELIWQTNHRNR